MRAIFIRHGENTGNAGVPCHDLGDDRADGAAATNRRARSRRAGRKRPRSSSPRPIPAPGRRPRRRSRAFPACRWKCGRSKSSPICNRRAGTARAAPSGCRTSNAIGARPILITATGKGRRASATLLRRCEAALARLAAMPAGSLAYVFGHGQFIQAARAIVADAHLDDRAKMRAFWRKGEPPAIGNAQRVGFHWQGDRWTCAPALAA
jgi:hypothetical protein